MTKLGFIGLGVMGSPMAAHLAAAGFDVGGYDLNAEALAKLEAAGGRAAESAADAAAGADVVVTMLPDHPQVEAVVLAPGGVLDVVEPGTLVIDMSTIRPETSIEIARAFFWTLAESRSLARVVSNWLHSSGSPACTGTSTFWFTT